MRTFFTTAATVVFLCFVGAEARCAEGTESATQQPSLSVLPSVASSPPHNLTTPEKVALGYQLFFDPRLSGDNTKSCASCHLPENAFGDGLPRALGRGDRILARNTPTLLNVGFHATLFWDGRSSSLEDQSLVPIQSPDEMNQDLAELESELQAVPAYASQFAKVFGRTIQRQDVARALAAFQRTLITPNSPFDLYLAGERAALSPLATEGLELFVGDAGCVRCHNGPLLSDGQFYRLRADRGDHGRGQVTQRRDDDYRFRTPSLRNVAETGPYMHDGSMTTLFDVVQFYYRGVPSRGPDDLPLDVTPLLGQSYSEIDAIVEFLKSLSGERPDIIPAAVP